MRGGRHEHEQQARVPTVTSVVPLLRRTHHRTRAVVMLYYRSTLVLTTVVVEKYCPRTKNSGTKHQRAIRRQGVNKNSTERIVHTEPTDTNRPTLFSGVVGEESLVV